LPSHRFTLRWKELAAWVACTVIRDAANTASKLQIKNLIIGAESETLVVILEVTSDEKKLESHKVPRKKAPYFISIG
jgi:hypothetical protein